MYNTCPYPPICGRATVMVPNEPGFEETEALGSDPSVDASPEPNESEATSTAAETHATDVSDPEAAADTQGDPSASTQTPVNAASPSLKRGDLVEGTIISTSPTLVTVDVGAPKEGVIPGHEL